MKTTQADKWMSIYIRLRDSDENGYVKCCTCGRIKAWRQSDNCHFIKRQFMASRFSETNCNAGCKYCNNFLQGNDVNYAEFIKKKYGEQEFLLLMASKRHTKKYMQYELDAIAKIYKAKAEKIASEKGLKI